MRVNYMQVGLSASFTFTKNGKKVHFYLEGNLENKTMCGVDLPKLVDYPYERQSRTPDFCAKCQKSLSIVSQEAFNHIKMPLSGCCATPSSPSAQMTTVANPTITKIGWGQK